MIVLITGSNSGIGQATVLRLARSGHEVFASVRDPAGAEHLEAIAQDESLLISVIEIDVTSPEGVESGVRDVFDRAGHVDVLINNAGIGGLSAIEETSDAQLTAMFESNFLGPIRMIRSVLPSMRQRESGFIVNVSSLLGRLVFPPLGPYAASKYALEAASESLAQELRGSGIRVAIVEPGLVITPLLRKHPVTPPGETRYANQYRRASVIFRRLASIRTVPEDVAAVIEHAIETTDPKLRYLVGDDARLIAGRRALMSDEEWLGPDRQMTDTEWLELAGEALDIDFATRFPDRAA